MKRKRKSVAASAAPPAAAEAGKEGWSPARMRAAALGLSQLRALFHLPVKQAAVVSGAGDYYMRERCMELGIRRWPYRKIAALKQFAAEQQSWGVSGAIAVRIREVYANPGRDSALPTEVVLARQARYHARIRKPQRRAAAAASSTAAAAASRRPTT